MIAYCVRENPIRNLVEQGGVCHHGSTTYYKSYLQLNLSSLDLTWQNSKSHFTCGANHGLICLVGLYSWPFASVPLIRPRQADLH